MAKRTTRTLPLIELFGISVVFHVLLLFGLGTYFFIEIVREDPNEFEAIEQQEEQVEEVREVLLPQTPKMSQAPIERVAIDPLDLPTPDLPANIPTVTPGVSFVGTGIGSNLGAGGTIDLEKGIVDFLGVRSSGEKFIFLIDASRSMMDDDRGSIPGYTIIKDELVRQIDGLPAGTLFNVIFFDGNDYYAFRPKMIPARPDIKQRLQDWLAPINTSKEQLGVPQNNMEATQTSIEPMEASLPYWTEGLQIAMEQQADAIFILGSEWGWLNRQLSEKQMAEVRAWREAQDWTDADERAWEAALEKARNWVEKENAERAKRGLPPNVNPNHWSIAKNRFGGKSPPLWPPGLVRRWELEHVVAHFKNAAQVLYQDQNYRPEINVILLLGEEEETDAEENRHVAHFEEFVERIGRNFRIVKGLRGIQNVTSG